MDEEGTGDARQIRQTDRQIEEEEQEERGREQRKQRDGDGDGDGDQMPKETGKGREEKRRPL